MWMLGANLYGRRVAAAAPDDPKPNVRAFRVMSAGTVAIAVAAVVLAVPA
jgi:hypothetical protein